MSGTIYFVQPSGGGHIKIGYSSNPQMRWKGINRLFPYGIDVLATMDGTMVGEAFLHQCFRPLATSQEWFKAGPATWRFLLSVIDEGAPNYVPRESNFDRGVMYARIRAEFGSFEAVRDALGYSQVATPPTVFPDSGATVSIWARWRFYEARRDGLLPDFIDALHDPIPANEKREAA